MTNLRVVGRPLRARGALLNVANLIYILRERELQRRLGAGAHSTRAATRVVTQLQLAFQCQFVSQQAHSGKRALAFN